MQARGHENKAKCESNRRVWVHGGKFRTHVILLAANSREEFCITARGNYIGQLPSAEVYVIPEPLYCGTKLTLITS